MRYQYIWNKNDLRKLLKESRLSVRSFRYVRRLFQADGPVKENVRQWFVAINAWRAPLAWCHVSMSLSNCSAVLDGQLYTHSRSHWPSTSAFCHSAEVGHSALSTEQFRSSALFCGGPVDLEFAARQSSWPRTVSWYFQTSAEVVTFLRNIDDKMY